MGDQAQRKGREDHVREAAIQDSLRISAGRPGIGKSRSETSPLMAAIASPGVRSSPTDSSPPHPPRGEAAEDGRDDPQHSGDERMMPVGKEQTRRRLDEHEQEECSRQASGGCLCHQGLDRRTALS